MIVDGKSYVWLDIFSLVSKKRMSFYVSGPGFGWLPDEDSGFVTNFEEEFREGPVQRGSARLPRRNSGPVL